MISLIVIARLSVQFCSDAVEVYYNIMNVDIRLHTSDYYCLCCMNAKEKHQRPNRFRDLL